MRFAILAPVAIGLLAGSAWAQQQPAKPPAAPSAFKTLKDKASYGIGVNIGNNFKKLGFDLDLNLLTKGIADAMSGAKPLLDDKELQETMDAFQQEVSAKQAEKTKKQAEQNKLDGVAFHADNKKKPGVTTLPSGLQYKVIKAGTGKASPKATDSVTTHYKGTLLDGTVFDSSYDRGEPTSFGVNQVIKGWTEALQLMKVGDKWQLYIPGELAYGERGAPGSPIGPNSSLVFEIELLKIDAVEPIK